MQIDSIIRFFCIQRGVDYAELKGFGRTSNLVETRFMVWHYLHFNMGLSCTVLSKLFHRNRPSIFRGIRVVKQHMRFHKHVKEEYDSIVKKIKDAPEEAPSDDME